MPDWIAEAEVDMREEGEVESWERVSGTARWLERVAREVDESVKVSTTLLVLQSSSRRLGEENDKRQRSRWEEGLAGLCE
jgi:hypothetical protein